MITITRLGNNKIMIEGHSQPDICAATSSIMYVSVKLLERYDKKCIKFTDENDVVTIEFLKRDNFIDMIFTNMMECFLELHQDVPPGTMALCVLPDDDLDKS